MAITYKLLSNVTLVGNTTVTISGIPQTYDDLALHFNARLNSGSQLGDWRIAPNATSASGSLLYNYATKADAGTYGTEANSISGTNWNTQISGSNGNTWPPSAGWLYIPSYSRTTGVKGAWMDAMYVNYSNPQSARGSYGSYLFNLTSAITSLEIKSTGSTFMTGSYAQLYGIKRT